MNQIHATLKQIGLNEQEARIYLKLHELQEAQTGVLSKEARVPSSHIYSVLGSLMEKGLVSYKLKNNIKLFMPSSPEALHEFFAEKKQALEREEGKVREAIASLKKREMSVESPSNYKYFEGITGIKAMWHEINAIMKKGSVIVGYTAKRESFNRLVGFFDEQQRLRKKLKVKAKIIFSGDSKDIAERREDKLTKILYKELENDAEWGVLEDAFYMQYIIGKTPRDVLPPQQADDTIAKIQHVFMSGESIHQELLFHFPNGDVWHDMICSPVIESSGNVSAVVAFIRDVTERKHAEEALQEREARLNGILSSLDETIIILFDRESTYKSIWSFPDVEERYGVKISDFVGKTPRDMLPPQQAEETIANIQKVFKSGNSIHQEILLHFPKGNFWHDGVISPVMES